MTQKQEKLTKKQRQLERIEAAKRRQRIRLMMTLTIIAVILVGGGFGIYYATGSSAQTSEPVEFAYNTQPVMGDPDAPVKIVEFGDYRCPSCKQFDALVLPKVKKNYIETGKAAYYFINFPILGEGSVRAALAAESVYHHWPDLFWQYHEAIYDNQGDENKQWATIDFLTSLAVLHAKGVNPDQLYKDIKQKTYLDEVKSDKKKAIDIGLTATPSIFVNGRPVEDPNFANLSEVIDKAYDKATGSSGDKG